MTRLRLSLLGLAAALVAAPAWANTATFTVANGCLIAPLQNVSWSGQMNDLLTSETTRVTGGNLPNPATAMRFPFTIRCPNGVAYRFSFNSANGTTTYNFNVSGTSGTVTDARQMRHSTHPTATIPYWLGVMTSATSTLAALGGFSLTHNAVPAYSARTGSGADQTFFIQPRFIQRIALPVRPLPPGDYTDTLTLALYF